MLPVGTVVGVLDAIRVLAPVNYNVVVTLGLFEQDSLLLLGSLGFVHN